MASREEIPTDSGRDEGCTPCVQFNKGRGSYVGRGKVFESMQPATSQGRCGRQTQEARASLGSKSPSLALKLALLQNSVSNFQAGKIAQFASNWAKLTSDREILSWVNGVCIDFNQECTQYSTPKLLQLEGEERRLMQAQLDKMLAKGIIEECEHENSFHIFSSDPRKMGQ